MATVTQGYTWTSGETVTPAKLNSTGAPTVVVADNEVTTAKILDANVTTAKIADANVTTAKIADANVTAAKLASNAVETAKIAGDAVTNDKLSLAANAGEIKKAINADNAPPIYACRAWVNFDGTRNEGDTGASTNGANVKIRASGNVASVLKNAIGVYTVTFATAMPDANFSALLTVRNNRTAGVLSNADSTYSTSSVTISTAVSTTAGQEDQERVNVAIFR